MIIKNRELTDQEVLYNNDRLEKLSLKDLILSDNIIDLYYRLGLYIAIDKNYNYNISNENIKVNVNFLEKHYKNIKDIKNKAYMFTYRKVNPKYHISECKEEIKSQFNNYYRKYFNHFIVNYQKALNITDDNIHFLTNDYQYTV